uniref:Pentacotripeptide-repeat region of PRORP domain-containing protein n=1 Tax=Fagus sylvatica TaxID=28930 RepID=A0A2N9J082_FAGSY
MAIPVLKRLLLFSTHKHKPLSFSSQPSDQSETLISTVVSILTQQRSKSRWGNLQSLYPNGFHPNDFSQIALQLKNNPHLALRFFLWTQHKSLCHHNLLTYSTTIHILTRARLLTQAHSLIRTAIRIPQQHNLVPKPLMLFQSLVMTYRACGSAPFVFDLLVKACLETKKIDPAIEIVRMLRSRGVSPKVGTLNDLVSWVLRVRGGCAGYEVYREVFGFEGDGVDGNVKRVFRVWPNVHTFNALMVGFYQDGLIEKVEMIWNEMVGFDCVPNGYSYSALMAAYCEEERMGEAEKLWEEMRVKEVKADVVGYNTMIGGFCKIGEVEKAEELYREMGLNGVETSCATYEHLVNGYCNVGDVDSALLVYKDMCRKGFRPEALTLDVVIGGLCVKGRVYEALEILRRGVESFGLMPKGKSYEALIKGLCEEGRMEEALKVQAEMVGKGFEPNLEIYGAFVDGYVKQGNEEMAEVLRNEMLENQMREKK